MTQQILPQGTVLSERFQIENPIGPPDLGRLYKAVDLSTKKNVALRVIQKDQIGDKEQIEQLRRRVREASALAHRNIQTTFGMGIHEDSLIFIACEWIEGENLRVLLDRRIKEGKRFSFKGAYNIIGHVCNATTFAHDSMFHGTLSPTLLFINSSGRVKVCDFALSTLRAQVEDYPGRKENESVFWAPEILSKKEGAAARAADIYSIGALFYELLTGRPPTIPLKAPSTLGFSREVDQVIARCMSPDPKQRFADTGSVKQAAAKLLELQVPEEEALEITVDDDLGINVEIDLDEMAGEPSKSGQATAEPNNMGSMLNAPGLPPAPAENRSPMTPGGGNPVSTIDMGELLSGLSSTETAKWMVQKDKFDHGPFTDRELVQMILLGEVEGGHQLLDMDTGVRKKVRAWEEFEAYLERYRIKKKQQEEEAAKVRAEKAEVRGTMARWLIVLIVVGVIGLAAGAYLLSRTLRKEKSYTPEEMVAALDSGEIKLKTGGNLIRKGAGKSGGRRGGGRRGGGKSGGGGGGAFVDGMSYEEAMNMGVSLGSLSNNAGQQQLRPQDITNIMDRNVRRFLPCMAGQTVKKVEMNIAIAGDGRVMGVSVAQGNDKLKRCVQSVVRSIKFPKSVSPRTAASWYFELY